MATNLAIETLWDNVPRVHGTYDRTVDVFGAPVRFELAWTFTEDSCVWEGRLDVNQPTWVIAEYVQMREQQHDESRLEALQRLVPVNLTVDWASDAVLDDPRYENQGHVVLTGRRLMSQDAARHTVNGILGL